MNFAGHYLSLHPYQPAANNAVFRLLSLDQQAHLCSLLQLPLRAPFSNFDGIVHLSQLQPVPSFVPYDENCLFTSICRVLTGEVTDHYDLRSIICQALYTYQAFLFPYDGCASASEYLARSKMFANAEWGGNLEILTFCFLTGCEIFVRDAYLGWIVYSSPFFQNEVSIYLLLQNFHYQPVSGHNRIPVIYPIPQVSNNIVPTTPSVNQSCSAFSSNSSELCDVRSELTKTKSTRRGGKITMQKNAIASQNDLNGNHLNSCERNKESDLRQKRLQRLEIKKQKIKEKQTNLRKNPREKIREWYQENKATANAKRRERYKNDDAYRASQKKRVSQSTTRQKNLIKVRQWLSNRINKTKNCLRSLRRFKLEEFREKNRKDALKRFQIAKLREENLLRSKKTI